MWWEMLNFENICKEGEGQLAVMLAQGLPRSGRSSASIPIDLPNLASQTPDHRTDMEEKTYYLRICHITTQIIRHFPKYDEFILQKVQLIQLHKATVHRNQLPIRMLHFHLQRKLLILSLSQPFSSPFRPFHLQALPFHPLLVRSSPLSQSQSTPLKPAQASKATPCSIVVDGDLED